MMGNKYIVIFLAFADSVHEHSTIYMLIFTWKRPINHTINLPAIPGSYLQNCSSLLEMLSKLQWRCCHTNTNTHRVMWKCQTKRERWTLFQQKSKSLDFFFFLFFYCFDSFLSFFSLALQFIFRFAQRLVHFEQKIIFFLLFHCTMAFTNTWESNFILLFGVYPFDCSVRYLIDTHRFALATANYFTTP